MAIDIIHGTGYRICESDRTIGEATSASDGFVVLNLTNNKLFVASGGVWTDGGTFPNSTFTSAMYDLWTIS